MLYLYIETSQERSGHTIMITDQQRLTLMIKTSHASRRRLTCNRKQKKTKKESENSTYTNGETDRYNLKGSSRGSIIWSRFFNQTTRETEPIKRSQRTLEKVVSREIVCFKIMKLIYNNSIYI